MRPFFYYCFSTVMRLNYTTVFLPPHCYCITTAYTQYPQNLHFSRTLYYCRTTHYYDCYDHCTTDTALLFYRNSWRPMYYIFFKFQEKEKYYDAAEFIKDSGFYFGQQPPNLIQTAAKLWLACVYAVKQVYLPQGIAGFSHRSLKTLMEFAVYASYDAGYIGGSEAVNLLNAWRYGEE